MRIRDAFALAVRVATRKDDYRTFFVGAVGVRADGRIVASSNILAKERTICSHAEARLAKKLDVGAVVYVARISRDNSLRLARPCSGCQRKLINCGVRRVYYTIDNAEYGVINL